MQYSDVLWGFPSGFRRALAAALAVGLLFSFLVQEQSRRAALDVPEGVVQSFARLPLSFEGNLGQAAEGVDFLARGADFTVLIEPRAATLSRGSAHSTTLELVGANKQARPFSAGEQPGIVNYFFGDNSSEWITNVPTHSAVGYEGVYPGIDVVYHGNRQELEYDFVVAPGADPDSIAVRFSGAENLHIEGGRLVLTWSGGELRWDKPVAYQEIDGTRRAVEAEYGLLNEKTVAFLLGDYDRSHDLVIDPVLGYSTFLGGTDHDAGRAIGHDDEGNIYIHGETWSPNYPTLNPAQPTYGGAVDGFVAKFNPAGDTLLYSTYLGGSDEEIARSLAVDPSGAVYVAGATYSTDFPTTPNAFEPTAPGAQNAYVTKLDPSGAITSSTYFGTGANDGRTNVALGPDGAVHVAGYTFGSGLPVTPDALIPNKIQRADAYYVKLSGDLSSLLYGTYLGGTHNDTARAITVDSAGNAIVQGWTMSTNFPSVNALQPAHGGGVADIFVTKIAADGSEFLFSTYLGGSDTDFTYLGDTLDTDAQGNIYIGGYTSSTDFPTLNAVQPSYAGGTQDAFVAKLAANGSSILFSTYLGGSEKDEGISLDVDSTGAVWVTGLTHSKNFITMSPFQAQSAGSQDVFITKLSSTGALEFSTYLGGKKNDSGWGVAVDSADVPYLTGSAASTDFPTVNPLQATHGGRSDMFLAILGEGSGGPPPPPPPSDDTIPPTVTLSSPPNGLMKDDRVKVKWTGQDNVGIDHYELYEKEGTSGAPVLVQSSAATMYQRTGDAGTTYCYQVVAFDAAENSGVSDERCTAVPHDDRSPSIVYSGAVTQTTLTGSYQGTLTVLDGAGQAAELSLVGSVVGVMMRKDSSSGRVDVYVDGLFDRTIDLYSGNAKNKVYVFNTNLASGPHTIELRWTGVKHAQSSGTALSLDAIGVISE